jgi:hypothetical protein
MTKPRRSAAEIIAFHFCTDIQDIRDSRYQPSRYASPSVFTVGDDYYAAPANNRAPKHKVGGPWKAVAEHYGRAIFESAMERIQP